MCGGTTGFRPSYSGSSAPAGDRLDLQKFLDAPATALAGPARGLDPAEGRSATTWLPVHFDHSRAQPARQTIAAFAVLALHVIRQAIGRVVGDLHGMVFRLERDHREDGPEDFLAGNGHRIRDVGKDRRLDEISAVETLRTSRASGDQ